MATDFIRDNAKAVIEGSPVSYVQKAELRGNLFDPQDISGAVSCVDTVFFVDHTEPLEVLGSVQKRLDWPLGGLLDGHEFLLIIEDRHKPLSNSQSIV